MTGGALTQAELAQQQYAPLQTAATGLFGMGQQYLNQPADQRLGGIANQYLGAQPNFGFGDIGQRLLNQGQDQQLIDIARQQFSPSTGAQALTSLGQQYVAQSPEEVAAQYIQQQQDLLAPSRERQYAQLQNQLFQTGRGGLSVGATGLRPSGAGGLGATTPEMEAYYNSLAQQDLQLASQAQEAGQRNVAFGAGLFGTGADLMSQYQAGQVGALSPFTTYLGAGSAIEELGQQPLQLGMELGGRSASAGGNVGQFLLAGGQGAARAIQGTAGSGVGKALMGLADNPYVQQGLEKVVGGIKWSDIFGATPQGNLTQSPFGNRGGY